jgi:hypothetical protein
MLTFKPTLRFVRRHNNIKSVRYYADYDPKLRAKHDTLIEIRREIVFAEIPLF